MVENIKIGVQIDKESFQELSFPECPPVGSVIKILGANGEAISLTVESHIYDFTTEAPVVVRLKTTGWRNGSFMVA